LKTIYVKPIKRSVLNRLGIGSKMEEQFW